MASPVLSTTAAAAAAAARVAFIRLHRRWRASNQSRRDVISAKPRSTSQHSTVSHSTAMPRVKYRRVRAWLDGVRLVVNLVRRIIYVGISLHLSTVQKNTWDATFSSCTTVHLQSTLEKTHTHTHTWHMQHCLAYTASSIFVRCLNERQKCAPDRLQLSLVHTEVSSIFFNV